MNMRYIITFLLFLFGTAMTMAQVKPNEFTEETAPDNSNFEIYSQKNGVNRRASFYNTKKYMAPAVDAEAIDYVPAATGNSSDDYAEFVTDPNGDTWYIDMTGRSFLIFANSANQGVLDAYLSGDNDTLFIITYTDTVVVPGLSDLDDQGFSIIDSTTYYTLDLSGTDNDFVLQEGPNITITQSGDTLEIAATPSGVDIGEINVGDNVGAGAEVYKEKGDTILYFRTLEDGGIVTITQGTNDITISATEVDGSTTNELQTLSYSNDTLYLTNGGFVVIQATDDQGITFSNDTIYLEDGGYIVLSYLTGSGTDGRIAYWQGDTLTSTIWEITPTYIRGSGTGWPHMENAFYSWRGDTNTGIKWQSADYITIHTGDATNGMLVLDGPSERFKVDVDDNGTAELDVSSTKIYMNKVPRVSATSTGTTAYAVGMESNGDLTKVVFGSGLTLTEGASVDTLSASGLTTVEMPHLFLSGVSVGSAQIVSLTGGTTYDTIELTTTYSLSGGITYTNPNASADKAVIFPEDGIYEITLTFSGELASAGTNQTVIMQWYEVTDGTVQGSGMQWGFETSAMQTYTNSILYAANAGDAIQLLLRKATSGSSNLTITTAKLTAKKVSD